MVNGLAILLWGRGFHRSEIEAFLKRVEEREEREDDDEEGAGFMKDRVLLFHELRVRKSREQ